MAKTVTETAVDNQLNIAFRLLDPKQGGALEERLRAEVMVAYTRSDQPGRLLGATLVLKLAEEGPTVEGAQLVTQAQGFHGDQAAGRLTADERNQLVALLMKLNGLGRECAGL